MKLVPSMFVAADGVQPPPEPLNVTISKLPFGVIVYPVPVAVNVVVWPVDLVNEPVATKSPPTFKALVPMLKVADDWIVMSPSGLA